jgi:hypothetical protein
MLLYTQAILSSDLEKGWNGSPKVNNLETKLRTEQNKVLFEENKGQVKDQYWKSRPDVLYYGQSEGMNFFIKNNGLSYQINRVDSWIEENLFSNQSNESSSVKTPGRISSYRVDINWLNAKAPKVKVIDAQPGYNNYYNVPTGVSPALNVKQYGSLVFEGLWPGVNLEYYSRNGYLESDWVLSRAENYKQIAFEIKGAELRIDGDKLIMKTPFGEIVEGALIAEQNGRVIKSRWVLTGSVVTLGLEDYDPNQPIRIDPPVRIWGTYYGGDNFDEAWHCTVDGNENIYFAGASTSLNSIASVGAHQVTFGGGGGDACLVKFDSDGVKQWGTYYGGSFGDNGRSCAVDASGNVYLLGSTQSEDGIATTGAHQTLLAGNWDLFLVKFNSSGLRLWGTYYGGTGSDVGYSCSVDGNNYVYIAGETQSNFGISTSGSHQASKSTGADAFLVKFNSNGVRQWGTYYGGTGGDSGRACSTDGSGNIYLAGNTNSSSGIATPGAHQTSGSGGFLVKFNTNGTRQWGTYYAGNFLDGVNSCATDLSGNVYLAGNTQSTINFATVGAHQETNGGGTDAYLVKFDGSGVRQWGTYYGGFGFDNGRSCSVDASGNVYLSGMTESTGGIASSVAYQTTYGGGGDAFLVKFNSSGERQWGTYYGDANLEDAFSCAAGSSNMIYIAGRTTSISSIATSGSHQSSFGGGTQDAFLVKFNGASCGVDGPFANSTCINNTISPITHNTVGATGIGTPTGLPSGVNASWNSNVLTISGTPTVLGTYNYSIPLIGTDCGSVTATGTITVIAANTVTGTANETVCINSPVSISLTTTGASGIGTATGLPAGVTATWASNTITISGAPTASGTFNYSIPLTGGCGSVNATGTITVNSANTVTGTANETVCINSPVSISLTTTGASGIGAATGLPAGVTAAWASNTITISGTPTASGTFNYSIPLTGGCGSVNATGTITVNPVNTVTGTANETVCINSPVSISITTTGATGIGTATGLPAGVTAAWASNTITISGTPTASGTFNYSIPLTGGCGSVNATGTITVNSANTVTGTANETVCINSPVSISLTTTGATGIGTATGLPAGVTATWASNTITISGTPTASGTFNYSIPLTGGCGSVNATGTITVNSANTVTGTANETVCINSPVSISLTTTGTSGIGTATGLPAGVTATWASNTITISGTPTASGTFNYSIPLTGGCGSVNATGTITVNALPSAPSAPADQEFCNNATVADLTATGSGVQWYSTASGGSPLSANDPITSSSYFASQTVNGCESIDRTEVTVDIISPAMPSGDAAQNFCSTATVADLDATGTDILWYTQATGGTALSSGTVLSNGSYYASQTINGCESQRLEVTVTITILDASTTVNELTISANQNGASYTWVDCNNGNQPIAGASGQSYTATANGSYAVIIEQNGCSVTSNCVAITTVGLEEVKTGMFRMYPNPASTVLNVEFSEINKIVLFDATGKLLLEMNGDAFYSIDVSNFASGVYLIKSGNQTQRFIKQ